MQLPEGYRMRAPTVEDADAIGEVLLAEQRQDPEAPVIDAHFVREVWSRSGFDLAADAWAVTDDAGTIVAYGQVQREEPDLVGSWGVVHPGHEGRGIGAALLDRIEARASELLAGAEGARFQHSVNAGDRVGGALLRGRGLRPIRHFWHMQVDLPASAEPTPPPDGVVIDAAQPPDDLRAVHAILVDAFVDDHGDHPASFERWAQEETASPSYDPSLWLVAREGSTPVGALTASADEGIGSVDWLGVRPSHRGRGIGIALLGRAFEAFATRGIRRAMVSVDAENPTGATGVYERVGMRVVGRFDIWERTAVDAR